MKKSALLLFVLLCVLSAAAQNPFLPLWEHIPDGEPYVFDDPDRPGHQRMYIYGSHDDLRNAYCGRDQVVWSAPVEDLTKWRYDGVCFVSQTAADGSQLAEKPDVLYAPDIVETVENGRRVYYFTPNNQVGGRQNMIARGYRPDGPFTACNWNADGRTTYGLFGFDPAIFRDDDGRIYGYWGFEKSHGAELDPKTMCTVKPSTKVVEDMIPSHKQPGQFRFFEASSMRKIDGMYVFIYSRFTEPGEFGMPSTNYTLAYAYSKNSLGPFTYGGTIIDGRARDKDEQGNVIATATPGGNTHGSLVKAGRQWYVVYHRQSGTTEFSRQAMAAPVNVTVKDGRVEISEGEYTSEGFAIGGLNPYERHAAGIACYYTGPQKAEQHYPNCTYSGPHIAATYADDKNMDNGYSLHKPYAPVVNCTDGSVVGYKYFRFDKLPKVLRLTLLPSAVSGDIVVMIDSPWESRGGKVIGKLNLTGAMAADAKIEPVELACPVSLPRGTKGKHALFLRFNSQTKGQSMAELHSLLFE